MGGCQFSGREYFWTKNNNKMWLIFKYENKVSKARGETSILSPYNILKLEIPYD